MTGRWFALLPCVCHPPSLGARTHVSSGHFFFSGVSSKRSFKLWTSHQPTSCQYPTIQPKRWTYFRWTHFDELPNIYVFSPNKFVWFFFWQWYVNESLTSKVSCFFFILRTRKCILEVFWSSCEDHWIGKGILSSCRKKNDHLSGSMKKKSTTFLINHRDLPWWPHLPGHPSRWAFSLPFFFALWDPGEFDGVLRSQFSFFPKNRLSRMKILRHTTQLYILLQEKQLILSHHHSLTFCWAFLPAQHVWDDISCHFCILFQTCNFDAREDASNYTTWLFYFGKGICPFSPMGYVLCCLNFWRVFARLSWPSYVVRKRTIVLFVSEPRICFQIQVHDWNYKSLLSNTANLLSTDSILPLSLNVGFLSFSSLGYCSSFYSLILDSDVSNSHRLIDMQSYRRLPSLITRLPTVSNSFLITQCQYCLRLNRILQCWLVQSLQHHFARCFACWQ